MLFFIIVWSLFCLFSFTQQDLNLTLYHFPYWNNLAAYLQKLGFYYRPYNSIIFFILAFLLTYLYLKLIKIKFSSAKFWPVIIILLALPAYPIFSYDIFNYLFNAKMVLVYNANPHIRTAVQFIKDPMLRFMRNVHTPAPYAYGWTLTSLIPGLTWFLGKFTLSFWSMKFFVALFWIGELMILKKLVQQLFPKQSFRWLLLALNPLILVETLINGHNDVVMMLPALLSFLFLLKSKKLFDKNFIHALFFLTLSASIKYATLILLPFYFLSYFQGSFLKVCLCRQIKKTDLPALFSWLLLATMFIRPDQLHSWYLIWPLSFAVLSKSKTIVSFFTALSIGALFRYLPYLYFGYWDPPVYLLRNLIWLSSLFLFPVINKTIKQS